MPNSSKSRASQCCRAEIFEATPEPVEHRGRFAKLIGIAATFDDQD
ncbi:hypothetical protein QF035_002962 [Streptomyces umbrinus]|uniref:Uncharacterized protein n=1 Tax=Streptomyces umbrinus TaxID=67370 RepID=A0ABU0SP97_9ACTN|nr:hypothetical protein [Streptomyces umbrinus]MDQ1025380.1 hypothetical protein [Streptomyces umbrinus]